MTKIMTPLSAFPVFVPGVRLILVSFPLFLFSKECHLCSYFNGIPALKFLFLLYIYISIFGGKGIPNPNNKAPSLKTN